MTVSTKITAGFLWSVDLVWACGSDIAKGKNQSINQTYFTDQKIWKLQSNQKLQAICYNFIYMIL